jgi:hypothetical protein
LKKRFHPVKIPPFFAAAIDYPFDQMRSLEVVPTFVRIRTSFLSDKKWHPSFIFALWM